MIAIQTILQKGATPNLGGRSTRSSHCKSKTIITDEKMAKDYEEMPDAYAMMKT
jgi:hypothetical protein